ncbi:hypothetical protein AVW11_03950 [Streptomyces amritsarensis]|uniref:SWIM-type domain-containing protein n=1 Tax=Streptomyces amritsarensis TaxID=681158 RepID=A0ABX3GD49_9ACTN|nr:hypothetical protein [Streptomyces amritsarensis]OLZ72554.1 hypothetical protein AVW11_03950 [Streptomyces amritsarensis]
MDSTDFQAPCNCGALGDHPRNVNCDHLPIVEIEVTGRRSACLQAMGILRASYYVEIEHEWQDPETERWVFKLSAVENLWKTTPPYPEDKAV